MKKILQKIIYHTNPYRFYYHFFYYYPFGKTRINNLKEVKIKKEVISCRLEIELGGGRHHSFLFVRTNSNNWFFKKWFYWTRKFAFQLPNSKFWFKAPKLTPWDYNSETGEIRFGFNYSLIKRFKENDINVQDIKFVTWM